MIVSMLLTIQIAVIAHRGEHLSHAENTVPAIESAIALGADYVELDVRTTKDGKLVLMHDKTVERTTLGQGNVKDLTAAQIMALSLRGFPGGVPSFEEALDAARGRIRVYVDWKEASPEALSRALTEHGMVGDVVVYGDPGELARLQKLLPAVRVMPEADSEENLDRVESVLKPTVIACDEGDFKPGIIDRIKAMKADLFVDRLWDQDKESLWQGAIDRGATGIQTNYPEELVAYLRSRHLHP